MTSLHAIVPSQFSAKGHDGSSLFGAASVDGNAFANVLAGITPGANTAQTGIDPLAQLTALIANGTPLSKIVDQLSQSVGDALQKQLAGVLSQSDIDQIKSSLKMSIAHALAPPGNGPPGTPQQQAAALASRLRRLIETLARDATTTCGQQNDIAGNILDAKSAKEIPARTQGHTTASTLDVSSLVSSLLSAALSAIREGPPATRVVRGDPRQHIDPSRIALEAMTPAASPPSSAPAANVTPAPSTATPDSSNLAAPTLPAITMQNAPDLLARMLVRAAGADAKLNGASALASGVMPSEGATQGNAGLVTRLEALLASAGTAIAANAASSDSSSTGAQTGNSFGEQLAQQPALPSHDVSSPNGTIGVAIGPQSTQLQSLAQQAPAAAAHVDTSAVIAQMMKSMVMRTNAQGTSEIRLHLQPENLGDVTMKITVTGSQISANVVASSADVRNALVSNHHQLARSLADAGLTLSGFSVDVSGGNAGRDRQNDDRTAGFGRRYTVHELKGGQGSESPAIAALGPPLMSGSSLALFNYLA